MVIEDIKIGKFSSAEGLLRIESIHMSMGANMGTMPTNLPWGELGWVQIMAQMGILIN